MRQNNKEIFYFWKTIIHWNPNLILTRDNVWSLILVGIKSPSALWEITLLKSPAILRGIYLLFLTPGGRRQFITFVTGPEKQLNISLFKSFFIRYYNKGKDKKKILNKISLCS